MKKIIYILIILCILPLCSAITFDFSLNPSDIPYSGNKTIEVTANTNSTIKLIYTDWLSGDASVYLNNINSTIITIFYTVPNGTSDGYYTRVAVVSKNDSTTDVIFFNFNISSVVTQIEYNSWDNLTIYQKYQLLQDLPEFLKRDILAQIEAINNTEEPEVIIKKEYVAVLPNETKDLISQYENERVTSTRTHNLELQSREDSINERDNTISYLRSVLENKTSEVNTEKSKRSGIAFSFVVIFILVLLVYLIKIKWWDRRII